MSPRSNGCHAPGTELAPACGQPSSSRVASLPINSGANSGDTGRGHAVAEGCGTGASTIDGDVGGADSVDEAGTTRSGSG